MSEQIYYRQSGGISVKAPLEAFHDAMLPLLRKYGITERLPADKPSTAYEHIGIDFDVLIGEPPNAVRYSKYQPNAYESGFFEMKLEATLQNAAAGDSLFLKIDITNAAPKPTKGFWLNVEFEGEKNQVEAIKNAIKPVLAKFDFELHETESKLMSNFYEQIDFETLARKSNESGGAKEDLNNLFGATFALEKWLFIARGELPNVNPYIAANADYADGQQMIRAFTDSVRLQRFAKENNLTDADGSAQMLTVPTLGIVEYLEQFIQYGVHGVWFNSDSSSDGYFIPLKQLRLIKVHLAKINWQSVNQPTDPTLPHNSGIVPPVNSSKPDEQSAEIKTAVVMMQDGLMSSENVFTTSPRSYFCFCRLPASWADGERVKNLVSEKLFEIVYRQTWDTKKPPEGSRYIVPQPKSKVYSREEAGKLDWNALYKEIVGDVLFLFYIADENGELREVTETKFRAEIDLSFQKTLEKLSGYTDWFRSGTINFETTFKPFFHALKPLLANYAGAGEYDFAFAGGIDEPVMKDCLKM